MKVYSFAFVFGFVLLLGGLWDNPDLDLYGLTVPAWSVGVVFFLLGGGLGWAVERSRTERS